MMRSAACTCASCLVKQLEHQTGCSGIPSMATTHDMLGVHNKVKPRAPHITDSQFIVQPLGVDIKHLLKLATACWPLSCHLCNFLCMSRTPVIKALFRTGSPSVEGCTSKQCIRVWVIGGPTASQDSYRPWASQRHKPLPALPATSRDWMRSTRVERHHTVPSGISTQAKRHASKLKHQRPSLSPSYQPHTFLC